MGVGSRSRPECAKVGRMKGRLIVAWIVPVYVLLGAACSNPCKQLEAKVCDDPKYVKANKRHCELMRDTERRENLSKDTCKGLLDFIAKR